MFCVTYWAILNFSRYWIVLLNPIILTINELLINDKIYPYELFIELKKLFSILTVFDNSISIRDILDEKKLDYDHDKLNFTFENIFSYIKQSFESLVKKKSTIQKEFIFALEKN